jgi:hypothetical protein
MFVCVWRVSPCPPTNPEGHVKFLPLCRLKGTVSQQLDRDSAPGLPILPPGFFPLQCRGRYSGPLGPSTCSVLGTSPEYPPQPDATVISTSFLGIILGHTPPLFRNNAINTFLDFPWRQYE